MASSDITAAPEALAQEYARLLRSTEHMEERTASATFELLPLTAQRNVRATLKKQYSRMSTLRETYPELAALR